MPEETNDTVVAGEGQDTVAAQADDTVVAGEGVDTVAAAAEDTVTAGGGVDTVVAGEGEADPFKQFDGGNVETKVTKADEAPATDEELAAIEAEADETDAALSAGGKLSGMIKKLTARDKTRSAELQAVRKRSQEAENDANWSKFERGTGISTASPEAQKMLGRDRLEKRFADLFKAKGGETNPEYARGAASVALEYEVKQILAQTKERKKPVAGAKFTDTGGRLSPPGGGGGRTPKPQPAAEDVFIQGDWSYPNPVGEA